MENLTGDTNDSWRQGFEEGYAAGIADAAALLTEALPLVEQAEFLLDRQSYYYGCDPTEPSPPEWGVTVGYQQFRPDQSPHDMFLEDVEQYHRENRDEDDGLGDHLTVANKILRALSTSEKGEAR
jgi:hypothetical protein